MSSPKGPHAPARDVNHAQRVELATRLRIAGYQWEEIADLCGIKGGKGAAYHLVNNALRAHQREASDELRQLETLRLDALLQAVWPQAVAQAAAAQEDDGKKKGPNLWAVDRALAIMDRRAKLLGLDTPTTQANTTAQVIIREYGVDVAAV